MGEAKASGNLGNTLKVLGKFDEAIVCCLRHLDLSRELKDRVSLYHCSANYSSLDTSTTVPGPYCFRSTLLQAEHFGYF